MVSAFKMDVRGKYEKGTKISDVIKLNKRKMN